jgi:GTP-binding protein
MRPGISAIVIGIQFLRHNSRSSHLLFVLSFELNRGLEESYSILLHELESYDPNLVKRPQFIVINKSDLLDGDLPHAETWREELRSFQTKFPHVMLVSAKQHLGLETLQDAMRDHLLKPPMAMVS